MFLIVFILVHGGLQAYVMHKAVAAFGPDGPASDLALGLGRPHDLAPMLLWPLEHCDLPPAGGHHRRHRLRLDGAGS